jgi:hypothetical protein
MSDESQKPDAPGAAKAEPANTQPEPQQNQGDGKSGTGKPANPQQK